MDSTVDLPMTLRGSTSSTRLSAAAWWNRASSDIARPGAIAPPRYSPSTEIASNVVAVPDVDDDAGTAVEVVCAHGVRDPVGTDLFRVVVEDRHPRAQTRLEDDARDVEPSLGHLAQRGLHERAPTT